MSDEIFLSGTGGKTTRDRLSELLSKTNAETLFFASAYVTQGGVSRIERILDDQQIELCVAVFGLDGNVTQPIAIESARELGWPLRLIEDSTHLFHPKLALAGGPPPHPFSKDIRGGYIGSANFTKGGLVDNIEAGLIVRDKDLLNDLREVANEIWDLAEPVDEVDVEAYARRYAKAARERPTDYQPPGVGASVTSEVGSEDDSKPPQKPTYNPIHATAAWAGLESFTGEFTFQLEFPRTAGEVIRSLVGSDEAKVDVACSDNKVRQMKYKFYEDNGMFRLNIPNEVPGVERARQEETGIGIVRKSDQPDLPLRLEIINDETLVREFVQRSKREGSWGETSTRLYGWF